mgnify:FL=1
MKYSKIRYDLLVLIIVIIGSVISIKRGVDRYGSLRDLDVRMRKEISAGMAKKKILLSRLKDLDADSHTEIVARARLGYIKNGEAAYKVIVKE